ncbi:hypothetical protein KSP40_PGU014965 [Platanthera guangdongensis]|uniref:Uncharacterized protein n=1 Tax=Platanthera guangdongensis TaxID=2320717 RepID=A0ABR2MTC3_9ASPA
MKIVNCAQSFSRNGFLELAAMARVAFSNSGGNPFLLSHLDQQHSFRQGLLQQPFTTTQLCSSSTNNRPQGGSPKRETWKGGISGNGSQPRRRSAKEVLRHRDLSFGVDLSSEPQLLLLPRPTNPLSFFTERHHKEGGAEVSERWGTFSSLSLDATMIREPYQISVSTRAGNR